MRRYFQLGCRAARHASVQTSTRRQIGGSVYQRISPPTSQLRLLSTSKSSLHATPTKSPSESGHPDYMLAKMPSPPRERATTSAKLAALHSRLSLPARLPIETLARTLVTASADPDARFNNSSLAVVGSDLLGYYVSEHIICHYPRIPMAPMFSAQAAYVGPRALQTVAAEWGVETVAEPGGEVDPGLLQFRRMAPGTVPPPKLFPDGTDASTVPLNRRISTRVVYDDQFGDMNTGFPTRKSAESVTLKEIETSSILGLGETSNAITSEEAHASFVRALVGAIYLHCGRTATRRFVRAHFLSRSLDIASLFEFSTPVLDLAILCSREGFQAPVARLLTETGRVSRHAVFVVGIFSGNDKLGEGAGASLDEARTRAATASLMSWYLYSPLDVTVPSDTEGKMTNNWVPNHVDSGEIFR